MTNLKVVSKPEPVSFNDVLKTLTEYLENDTDLIASDIKASDRLSYDLNLDSLNRLEMIMHIEKVYGIEIEDTTDLERADTLAEFVALCKNKINQEKIVFQLGTKNSKFIPSPYTKNINKITSKIQTQLSAVKPIDANVKLDYNIVFDTIKQHLLNKYGIQTVKKESNWYKSFGLNDFDRNELFEWVEKKFNIKLGHFYFTNIDSLCVAILNAYFDKNKIGLLQRIKAKFVRAK